MAAGVTLGFLKYVLGLDSITFRKGMTAAERDLVKLQKSFEKKGQQLASMGKSLTVGLTLPIAGIAAAGIREAQETQQAMGQVNAALASMGPVAGRTADQLKRAADALELKSTFEADEILRKITANMLTFGNVSGQAFDRAQQAAVDLATRMGTDLQSAALLVGKALNDPTKGMTALGRAGIQFSSDQKQAIKAMVEGGNAAGAQAIILGELERQFKGSAAAAANTDPLNQANKAWKQMAETVGQALLPILPVIRDAIVSITTAFTSLSPETQRWILIAAAGAAAIGPLLIGLGTLVTLAASSAPLVAALGTAFGLLGPATATAGTAAAAAGGSMAALTPILIPLAAAVAGVYLAYQNWDKIAPFIDGVVQRTTQASSDINAKLKVITDGANALDQRMGIPSKDQFISKIIADVQGGVAKIDAALAAIQSAAAKFDAAVVQAFRSAGASVQSMVANVTAWLMKLQVPFNWVVEKTKAVANAFYDMANKVVFNSYVPDMVDGIAAEMARLDAVLVKPAAAATTKTAEAFRALQERVGGLLARLFPEQATNLQFNKDLQDLRAYADQARWSLEQLEEATNRLRSATFNLQDTPLSVTQTPTDAPETMPIDWEQVGRLADQTMPKIVDQTNQWTQLLGDIGTQLLPRLVDDLLRVADGSMKLKDVWKDLLAMGLQLFANAIAPGGGGFNFGGFRAAGGPVVSGTSYLVGERGPEIFQASSSGRIHSSSDSRSMLRSGGGRGGVTMNVYTNDADSFRRSESQTTRQVRRRLGVA